jgi:aconitase B
MIIETPDDVTRAVLGEMHRTPNARTEELLSLLVKHLHAFVREARLSEREFQEAIATINAIGKRTTPSHNEAMLLAGALGVSNLICLINNTQPTQANNLGPF